MTIVLQENKFVAYPKAISEMLQQGWTSSRELEMNIRRWVHLGQIVLTVHHILSRLHFLKQQADRGFASLYSHSQVGVVDRDCT